MQRTFISTLTICLTLLLSACSDDNGISKESSRQPKGNPNGLVTVTEFSDLQCPACRAAHTKIVAPLLEQYGDVIRFEHKHFPLRSIHRYAMDAAEASECASDQGKFWEFIDISFENQQDMNHDTLVEWAEELQLDVAVFEKCWKSHAKKDVVLEDYKEGREAGVSGTPAFFVDGERIQTGFDTLSEAIEAKVGVYEQRL